ncbi:MAG TPA: hypothetical protein VNJ05_10880, partial [Sphingomicrobium sp.]|nr:hypothetical protein [Sphingomicrobium sp.]
EGLAINLTPGAKPTLTLAGVRADRLSLTSSSTGSTGEKLGMSEGAKIALGIGAAVLVGSGVLYAVATHCGDHEDECP